MSQHPISQEPAGFLDASLQPVGALTGSALNRRQFLKRAALTTEFLAGPMIIPASVLGRDGAVPPSERIVLGGIGLGGRGTGVLNWMLPERDVQFVAICDPKRSQREAIKRMVDNR
jgi:hypothetical protein